MIMSKDAEKVLEKFNIYLIKTLSELEVKQNCLYLIKRGVQKSCNKYHPKEKMSEH